MLFHELKLMAKPPLFNTTIPTMTAKPLSILLALLATAILPPTAALANTASDQKKAAEVAEKFINSYVRATERFQDYMAAVNWVKRNPLASPNFKKRLEQLYLEALREEPEIGYGSDAVVGGQDSPINYKAQSVKIRGNRAFVVLLGTVPFTASLRVILVRHKNSWLVEASGDLIE